MTLSACFGADYSRMVAITAFPNLFCFYFPFMCVCVNVILKNVYPKSKNSFSKCKINAIKP